MCQNDTFSKNFGANHQKRVTVTLALSVIFKEWQSSKIGDCHWALSKWHVFKEL